MAINEQIIHVFCPENMVPKVKEVLNNSDIQVVFNDTSLNGLNKKVICHYELRSLTDEQREFLVHATESGAWVEPLISYLDKRFGYTEVTLLQSSYFLHTKAFGILSTKRTQVVKRFVDLVGSLMLLAISLPVMILTAVLIKLDSKGPVFYKQLRVGQFNREFQVYKFRSMANDAEKDGAKWASKNDSRVTKVGSFIRKTRIDELPQLINVFRGEMSLVGPRPEREIFIKDLEKEILYYRFRHAVKPGVTGLAQVSYPYGDSIEDAVWKHRYDIYYIKHHSSLLDIKILLKTVKVVLFGMGR